MADLSEADVRLLTDVSRDPVVTDGDKYRIVMENERVRVKAGDVVWGKAQSHIGENVGHSDTHVVIVELKTG